MEQSIKHSGLLGVGAKGTARLRPLRPPAPSYLFGEDTSKSGAGAWSKDNSVQKQ